MFAIPHRARGHCGKRQLLERPGKLFGQFGLCDMFQTTSRHVRNQVSCIRVTVNEPVSSSEFSTSERRRMSEGWFIIIIIISRKYLTRNTTTRFKTYSLVEERFVRVWKTGTVIVQFKCTNFDRFSKSRNVIQLIGVYYIYIYLFIYDNSNRFRFLGIEFDLATNGDLSTERDCDALGLNATVGADVVANLDYLIIPDGVNVDLNVFASKYCGRSLKNIEVVGKPA